MSLISYIQNLFSLPIAMDLGTANTLLYTKAGGIIVNEPSVVDIDVQTNEVLAIGAKAKTSRGRTPGRVRNVRPMRDGVIADFDVTTRMIVYFIHQAMRGSWFRKPSMVISIPTGVTQVEKRAVINAALTAGATRVVLVEEPMASAIGVGLPIAEPVGSMVVDIGGGTTEVAVITLSAVAVCNTVRVAGDAMNEAIMAALRSEYRLEVGENTAEMVKIAIGSAVPVEGLEPMFVSGKDLACGCPTRLEISPDFVREALKGPVETIGEAVMRTMEQVAPTLAADIFDSGITMAGGGSLLRGMDQYISQITHLPVHLDPDPLTAVLRGTASVMMNMADYPDVFIN